MREKKKQKNKMNFGKIWDRILYKQKVKKEKTIKKKIKKQNENLKRKRIK